KVVARQVGEAEFLLGRELPGQGQLDGGGHGLGLGHQFGGGGFLELEQDVGGLGLDPLAGVELDLGRSLGFGEDAAGQKLAGFFKQCVHGGGLSHGCAKRQARSRKRSTVGRWSAKSLSPWSPPSSSRSRAWG